MMAAGYFLLSVHSETTFYVALFCIILGNGFFKPNISTLVGNLYNNDELRDKKIQDTTSFIWVSTLGLLSATSLPRI